MEATKLDVDNDYCNLSRPSDHYENWSFLKLEGALHGYNHQEEFGKHSMLNIHLAYLCYDFSLEQVLFDQECFIP